MQNTKKKIKAYKKRPRKTLTQDAEIEELKQLYQNDIKIDDITTFNDIPLSKFTLEGLKQNKYDKPTLIQQHTIVPALKGNDILGAAKTGSGKTLAFLIPILEKLYINKWTRLDGLGALIISPTRELAYQIFECLKKIGCKHDFSAGLIIGGKNLHFETKRMDKCNIVICTPGRLLQHMDENPLFDCSNLQVLVLDEADRCLDLGFYDTMNSIIENLPQSRQTLLFSATQTKSVKDLARLSLHDPLYISPHETSEFCTPKTLQQNYIVCNLEDKISFLFSFIRNHLKQKVLVFISSCKQVKYIYEAFCKLRPGTSLLALYGTLHQERREQIYEEFCAKQNVVMFATDLAARGLDFPNVNWVIQLDCPEDVQTYIHRAGRTARHVHHGESLLVLLPSEEHMINNLKEHKVPINKIQVDSKKLMNPQRKLEALLAEYVNLKESAQRAFIAYIKSVHLMKNKQIFDVKALNTDAYANSLGLVVPPRIRFLQRLNKKDVKDLNFEVSDSDDDVVKIKRKDHDIDINIDVDTKASNKTKIVTKAAQAKKILKKKIIPNTKVVFDEEGAVVKDKAKMMQTDYDDDDVSGINIEKAKEVLRKEDVHDKEKFKEKLKAQRRKTKMKLKNQKQQQQDDFGDLSEEESDVDLSWLPDPDKIYGPQNDDDDEADNAKRKIDDKSELKSAKRKKVDVKDITDNLTLNEAEDLALKLLG